MTTSVTDLNSVINDIIIHVHGYQSNNEFLLL